MRYKTGQYAEALTQALEGVDQVTTHTRIRTFVELLKKHQMLRKGESIAKIAERRRASLAGATRIRLESADPISGTCRQELTDLFNGKAWIEEKVHPQLLAGIRVLIDDETLIDACGQQQLKKMFQR